VEGSRGELKQYLIEIGSRVGIPLRFLRLLPALGFGVVLGGCATLLGGGPPGVESVVEGKYVDVLCHFDCGPAGPEALQLAEETWERVAEYLAVPPDTLLESRARVHLYGTPDDYADVADRLAGGQFLATGAFSSRDHRNAHILASAELSGLLGGLSFHHRRSVVHEAAHLAAYDLARGAYWPPWLAEGLAGWAERSVVVETAVGDVWEENPWASTQLWRVQRLIEVGALPAVGETLTGGAVELSLGDAYAFWIELFHFLVHGPWADEMQELVQDVARREVPEDRAWPEVGRQVSEVFSASDLQAVDDAFRSYVQGLRPGWIELFRSVEAVPDEPGSWLQHSVVDVPVGAFAWRSGNPGRWGGFRVESRVEPLGGPPWEIRLALVRHEGDPLLLSVDWEGAVRLLEFSFDRPAELDTLATNRLADPPPAEEAFAFGVRFQQGRVGIRLAGGEEVLLPLRDAEPTGLWGPGVGPGTVAIWRGFRVGAP
jgi:hypothetical protein